jgi:hypothetical protein
MKSEPWSKLDAFLNQLLARHQSLDADTPLLLSLQYALGLLRKRQNQEPLPPQWVVIGPTQAGKSTLVRLLMPQAQAEVSPLAGFTRHAQGFSGSTLNETHQAAIATMLAPLQPAPRDDLNPSELDRFSLSQLDQADPLVIWDSPDFDSVSARAYRLTVPLLCALADQVLLVVSKEKYADESVWQLLQLIAPTCPALRVLVNKVPPPEAAEIRQLVQQRFDQAGLPFDGVDTLPYLADPLSLGTSPEALALRQQLFAQRSRPAPAKPLGPWLQSQWPNWTQGLRQELAAIDQWQGMVSEALETAMRDFNRDYLANPRQRETLDQAMVKLLTLLEIPGIAAPLAQARQAITWPIRRLGAFFSNQDSKASSSAEEQLLLELLDQAHLRLIHQAGEEQMHSLDAERRWWRPLWQLLQQDQEGYQELHASLIKSHQQHFEPEIERTAQQLYRYLQEHPATLNALRAGRATADAAGVVLALKTGGIGVSDLMLTPAMLAFTSLLAEGAVGQYIDKAAEALKQRQLASIQQQVILPLQQGLSQIGLRLPTQDRFGISASELN